MREQEIESAIIMVVAKVMMTVDDERVDEKKNSPYQSVVREEEIETRTQMQTHPAL